VTEQGVAGKRIGPWFLAARTRAGKRRALMTSLQWAHSSGEQIPISPRPGRGRASIPNAVRPNNSAPDHRFTPSAVPNRTSSPAAMLGFAKGAGRLNVWNADAEGSASNRPARCVFCAPCQGGSEGFGGHAQDHDSFGHAREATTAGGRTWRRHQWAFHHQARKLTVRGWLGAAAGGRWWRLFFRALPGGKRLPVFPISTAPDRSVRVPARGTPVKPRSLRAQHTVKRSCRGPLGGPTARSDNRPCGIGEEAGPSAAGPACAPRAPGPVLIAWHQPSPYSRHSRG